MTETHTASTKVEFLITARSHTLGPSIIGGSIGKSDAELAFKRADYWREHIDSEYYDPASVQVVMRVTTTEVDELVVQPDGNVRNGKEG